MILYQTVMNGPQNQEKLKELFHKRNYYDNDTFEKQLLSILIDKTQVHTLIPFPYKQTAG
ncbi:hypothetical protein [Shimazuella alba]|jgi:hypothetical protein|uniref:Uncharacterized protein n=1 Tax=Shimazuella alba TaxID=2690964 RepID=A0A6I4VP97_9BACL|nr:hypothetical protein [Shimazuella alba]MXQ52231.1 hypothetical protein [Shimazuella alba]